MNEVRVCNEQPSNVMLVFVIHSYHINTHFSRSTWICLIIVFWNNNNSIANNAHKLSHYTVDIAI